MNPHKKTFCCIKQDIGTYLYDFLLQMIEGWQCWSLHLAKHIVSVVNISKYCQTASL